MSGQRSWRVRRSVGHVGYPKEEVAQKVERFSGPYKFLSNFFWSELNFEGLKYPSVEHAFQAAKLRENQQRNSYGFTDSGLSFGDAKRLGRQVPLRDDWKDIREDVMARCLWAKFQDPQLREKLLRTGESELVDGHSGSPDLIWGYHIPSQKGENRLGILLMDLRAQLKDKVQHFQVQQVQLQPAEHTVALFHLDWPVKCLHDGLPSAYATRLQDLAAAVQLAGCCVVLPRRKICIALQGQNSGIDAWEHRMRSENVDLNSRGRPCRERMLMELLRQKQAGCISCMQQFTHQEVKDWPSLLQSLSSALGLPSSKISSALGPEVPELPQKVQYLEGRSAVLLDGQRHALCLNESVATEISQALLGPVEIQTPLGPGIEIRLGSSKKPSIFGGKFARELPGLLSESECQQLIDLSEKEGYGLAGSRGFNPMARYAHRCLLDAPRIAQALTRRMATLLPAEYPVGSKQQLLGVNQRLRFLKYLPGMHHADHTDCAHEDENGKSFLTVQLYLNSSFGGGQTTFISDQLVPIEPIAGKAIVFDHELYHRGGMVTSGVKYALRMDVSYKAKLAGEAVARKSRWARK